jgi:hypothetical protein
MSNSFCDTLKNHQEVTSMGGTEEPKQEASGPSANPPAQRPMTSADNQAILSDTEAEERKKEIQATEKLIAETEKGNQETRTVEWLQFAVNAGLAVIGTIAVFVYLGQLGTMNRTVSEMQSQTEILRESLEKQKADSIQSGISTAKQLDLADAQVKAAQAGVEAVQTQTIQEERPWLKLSPFKTRNQMGAEASPIIASTGTPVAVPVQIENIGKTVARNVEINTFVQILNGSEEPSLDWVNSKTNHPHQHDYTGMFFPADPHVAWVQRIGDGDKPQLTTKEESDGLDNKSKYIVVFGIANYDVSNVRHWYKFCFPIRYDGPAYKYGTCITFNSEGEVKHGKNL